MKSGSSGGASSGLVMARRTLPRPAKTWWAGGEAGADLGHALGGMEGRRPARLEPPGGSGLGQRLDDLAGRGGIVGGRLALGDDVEGGRLAVFGQPGADRREIGRA